MTRKRHLSRVVIGNPGITTRGMKEPEMGEINELINETTNNCDNS